MTFPDEIIKAAQAADLKWDVEAHIQLERLKEWVQEKLDAGAEPPFAWYEYMKWREATEAIFLEASL